MRSLLIAVALLGCSSKTAPTPPPPTVAVAPDPPPPPPVEAPTDEPCAPRMESWPAGHHDRYLFHDEKTELSGYKNKAGAIVIEPRFVAAYPFGPGGIAAVIEPKVGLGFIDPSGKMIAKAHAMDNGPDYFQDGLARIIGKDKKIGYIDSTGKIVIPAQFDEAMPFCDGEADVQYFGRMVTIDKTGTFVKPN